MAFTYRIDKTSGIVYLEGEPLDIDEWRQTLFTLFADPDFKAACHFISDRRFSDKPRSTDFLKTALTFLKAHADQVGKCKWATVVSTTAAYGMGRMVQILSEDMDIEVKVFTNIDEARRWLTGEIALPRK